MTGKFLLALHERFVVGVSERSSVGQVHEDEEKGDDVNQKSNDHNGIPAPSDSLLAQKTEQGSSENFTHANEDSRHADELLGVFTQLTSESNAGAVDSTEERQLDACKIEITQKLQKCQCTKKSNLCRRRCKRAKSSPWF